MDFCEIAIRGSAFARPQETSSPHANDTTKTRKQAEKTCKALQRNISIVLYSVRVEVSGIGSVTDVQNVSSRRASGSAILAGLLIAIAVIAFVALAISRKDSAGSDADRLATRTSANTGGDTVKSLDRASSPPVSSRLPAKGATSSRTSLKHAQIGSLSPLSYPLASRIEALKSAAAHGDAAAGLELWYGLQQCSNILSRSETEFLRNADPRIASAFAATDSETLENCDGISADDLAQRYGWLKNAAEQGNAQAQFFYATAGSDALGGVNNALRNPAGWADYKDTAQSYLADLSERCDPYSISHLWFAYRNGDQVFAADPQLAFMYASVGELIAPGANTPTVLAREQQGLDREQIAAATASANAFYQSHCQ